MKISSRKTILVNMNTKNQQDLKFINLIKLESLIFQKIPTIPQKKSIHKFLLKSKTFSGSFQQITCIKFQLNCILQYKKDKHFNCFPHCMFYKIYSKYHKYCLNWLYILQAFVLKLLENALLVQLEFWERKIKIIRNKLMHFLMS